MASQVDKKVEFRKYLERKKVLEVLTKSLTDLFEQESRPDDPLQYIYSKIGEHVKKDVGAVSLKGVSDISNNGKPFDPTASKSDPPAKQSEPTSEAVSAKE